MNQEYTERTKFLPLFSDHFELMLKWLESPHVKKWWDQDISYTLDLVREKYESYTQGYKLVDGIKKQISAYIIIYNDQPIGFIQLYNAYDFPRNRSLIDLPQSLAAFDVFIGEVEYLGKGLRPTILSLFLKKLCKYDYVFADPDKNNIAAIKTYEKAGFEKIADHRKEIWMLFDKNNHILEELKSSEPIFHYPEKFGKTKQDIEAQMCEEFWEVGASGNVYTKHDVVTTLLERYNNPSYQDIWETSDFKLTQIAPNNYLLTYTLIQDKTRVTRRSTIWRYVNGKPKILYHQGTVIK